MGLATFTNILIAWPIVLGAVAIYFFGLIFYRLTFHPLAHFPGPRLTAVTRWYEGYFDLVNGGQYTFKIAQLHKEYGPIIRISPYEVHISDPTFYDTLYRHEARYDKYAWTTHAFGPQQATLFTVSSQAHRARRQPVAAFFSKARVAAHQHSIRQHLDKLTLRLSQLAETGTTFDLGAATTALARDAANDFILGKSYNSLDREDFDVVMLTTSQGSGQLWRLSKFFRFIAPLMFNIPLALTARLAKGDMKTFFQYLAETLQDTRRLMAAATSPTPDPKLPRTIVHEIMDSKLPPSEKTVRRMFQEVSTITGAGFETTASVLRLILFHIYTNPTFLARLRAELTTTGPHPDLKHLEQLPLLTSTLNEGLRMSPGVASRLARVPPTDLYYNHWRIPAGTAIGMTTLLQHMDETYYPDPTKFDPDRWINDDGTPRKSNGVFAPFSKGPRVCLGMYFAWAEMYLTIAELVQRFDFKFIDASATDFEVANDSFAIGTRGKGFLKAVVSEHRG